MMKQPFEIYSGDYFDSFGELSETRDGVIDIFKSNGFRVAYSGGLIIAYTEGMYEPVRKLKLSEILNSGKKLSVNDKPEWKAGFPPAGTVCEAMWLEEPDGGGREWCEVIYKRYFDSKVWFRHGDDEIILHTFHVEFRPIQSERDKVIAKAHELGLCAKDSELFSKIYDLGMLSMPDKGEE